MLKTTSSSPDSLRGQVLAIWQAALEAARPELLIRAALADAAFPLAELQQARRIVVVGAGKAGAVMSAALEEALAGLGLLGRVEGLVNVPAECVRPLRAVRLHAARPAGINQPTAEGVAGTARILELVAAAGPDDFVLCLISGGGSALLPAPAEGVTVEDKQGVTLLLHACGATINEMNAVRKHLSRVKGGQLARGFGGRRLFSLIISDVIGDPLDVIASGPTAADPTTFSDAVAVLRKYSLSERVPASVRLHLERGAQAQTAETLKTLPGNVSHRIIGNNAASLAAAQRRAEELGYRVLNLGSCIEGETRPVAVALAGIARSIRTAGLPLLPPACLLSGGETTVTLTPDHGLGGRNQEFVLAAADALARAGMDRFAVLSGGSDGEDGPTDAAGALADQDTFARAARLGLEPVSFLARHDSYRFFEATGDLVKTGLTQTNVMDVRLILVP